MALFIDELSTSLEIEDQRRLRALVREEVRRALDERERRRATDRVDPADPLAGGTERD